MTGQGHDRGAACTGLTVTARLIRAAAERRSSERRRRDAILHQRLVARGSQLPTLPGVTGRRSSTGGPDLE